MATEERCTHSPKKNRGINWTDEATEALLELWAEESIQITLCDKPQVKPPLVIDSSASSTADLHDTVNDENSEKGDNDDHDNDVSYDGSQPSLPFEEQGVYQISVQ
ncbi:hypothetical protein P5673_019715 [Acropora cervicornis]|uniref:Uncharacterized protein n=1 Tax=Acropora cervicornis TaxID=6130 RepID=A0AAD9QBF2_ACRCE|nr:hypothetical protein P5673_019715 [Acropora cervicornis]